MAADGASIRLEGADGLGATLAQAAANLADPRPLWHEIGSHVIGTTRERFETETGPDGKRWPESLRAQLTGGKTLTDTARMRNSIAMDVDGDGVSVGTNLIQAAIHQFGGVIRAKTAKGLRFTMANGEGVVRQSVTMPARPFLGLSDEDREVIGEIATDWLARATGGGGAD